MYIRRRDFLSERLENRVFMEAKVGHGFSPEQLSSVVLIKTDTDFMVLLYDNMTVFYAA